MLSDVVEFHCNLVAIEQNINRQLQLKKHIDAYIRVTYLGAPKRSLAVPAALWRFLAYPYAP